MKKGSRNTENRKQNVLLVHNYYQIPGGEDMVVANEKKMLEEHGHEVLLYSRSNAELKKMSKVQKLLLPFITIFNLRTYLEIRHIIKEKKVDIVHVHNTLNLISPSVYYAARSCKIPIVQTIHNFRFLCPNATFYRDGHICEDCVEKGLFCAVRHNCYRGSKLQTLACVINTKLHRITGIYKGINFICLTEFNKSKLLSLKQLKDNKIFIKPNSVEKFDEIIPQREREDQFVFAGRLDKLKGVGILLRAWKKIGDSSSKLIICGIGPEEEWCKDFVAENHLNVELRGFLSNDKVRKLIACSKALILPTQWYEGFPMSIVEAYSVGTPVVCSDLGNVGSIVQEGITGCKFKSDSIDELANAIKRIEIYKNIYETTYERYKKKYTEEQNYETLFEIYESV